MFVNFGACVVMMYFGPILAPELVTLGMSDANAGYGAATCWAVYAVGCPLSGYLCQLIPRRFVVWSSITIIAGALFLVGPSKLLNFPDQIYLIFIGLGFLGYGIAGVTVPVLPELVEAI